MKAGILGNSLANCDLMCFSTKGKDVFYVQNEDTLCCDIYVTSSDFGSYFNGDKMVRRVGEKKVYRVVETQNENGDIEYILTENNGGAPLGKARQGIPSFNRADCPNAPFFKAMICVSYYQLAERLGLNEEGLKNYVKFYNSCIVASAKKQENSSKLASEASADDLNLSATSVGDLGAVVAEQAPQNSEVQQQK